MQGFFTPRMTINVKELILKYLDRRNGFGRSFEFISWCAWKAWSLCETNF